eukprot:scaffold281825_cov19-Prasinocladus_malaysianus.AAC.1
MAEGHMKHVCMSHRVPLPSHQQQKQWTIHMLILRPVRCQACAMPDVPQIKEKLTPITSQL